MGDTINMHMVVKIDHSPFRLWDYIFTLSIIAYIMIQTST